MAALSKDPKLVKFCFLKICYLILQLINGTEIDDVERVKRLIYYLSLDFASMVRLSSPNYHLYRLLYQDNSMYLLLRPTLSNLIQILSLICSYVPVGSRVTNLITGSCIGAGPEVWGDATCRVNQVRQQPSQAGDLTADHFILNTQSGLLFQLTNTT